MIRNTSLFLGVLLLFATPAAAETLRFSYVGADGGFSFQSDSNPEPFAVSDDLTTFQLAVTGSENGVASDFGGGVYFYTRDYGGGFATLDGLFSTSGSPLFTGSVDAPTFSPQVTPLAGPDGATPDGVFTVAPLAVAAAPEPSGWLLLITGVAGTGTLLRRSTRKQRDASVA